MCIGQHACEICNTFTFADLEDTHNMKIEPTSSDLISPYLSYYQPKLVNNKTTTAIETSL